MNERISFAIWLTGVAVITAFVTQWFVDTFAWAWMPGPAF